MRKPYLIALAIVILIVGGYFLFGNKKTSYLKPTAGKNIIVFGDSLAAGQGADKGKDLASQLTQKTGLPTINAGVNGDITASSLQRLESAVLAKNPKVVIILLGGNDFFARIPNEQIMSNLTTIIDKIQQTGSGVILLNENKIFATTPLFAKLAKEKRIPYIENILGGIINHNELMSDQIHPNSAGYEIMAEKIKPVLLDYLK